jgi:hypothetical protein
MREGRAATTTREKRRPGRVVRWTLGSIAVLVAAVALLCVPWPEGAPPLPAGGRPFAWRQDARWQELEARFAAARAGGCRTTGIEIAARLTGLDALLAEAADTALVPDSPVLDRTEAAFFEAAPLLAACPGRLAELARQQARLRSIVKRASCGWDVGDPLVRDRLYRALYGSRAALEEALLQAPPGALPGLLPGDEVPSRTPSVTVAGVEVHSGDLLLSRGDAPTSALIARGNDYPGNFSHVALVHVEVGGAARVIEAHIERGVAVTAPPDYLGDGKRRILLLRPRADLPAVVAEEMLPHRAAQGMLDEALARHIAYDFAMDAADPSRLFCSEVASHAYRLQGVRLWMGVSRISSPGLAAWLAAFGVRHFETQEPSDLEYDPQLTVVAEWRDTEALWQDHVDNAVVEVMLEGAEAGRRIGYRPLDLPGARVLKAWSAVENVFGGTGPVPEGMSAVAALRHRSFTRAHLEARQRLLDAAARFERERGYRPPYWELLRLARETGAARAL